MAGDLSTANSGDRWFSVRCVFELLLLEQPGSTHAYEERLTLWNAPDAESAVAMAEQDAAEYEAILTGRFSDDEKTSRYLGFAQVYELPVGPSHGAEVFSLVRESLRQGDAYLDTFFDTGCERQGHID